MKTTRRVGISIEPNLHDEAVAYAEGDSRYRNFANLVRQLLAVELAGEKNKRAVLAASDQQVKRARKAK